MKRTRVEIYKNGTWVQLILKEEKIKYNTLSNKIGELENRRINGSNTFELPYVSENIIALDINVFSPTLMAIALNKKFPARYYVKDKLAQKGFLVINNTIRGQINVNFIDEALVITDEWGKRTFKQLLVDLGDDPSKFPKSVLNTNFMNSINLLKDYETDKSKKVLNTGPFIAGGGSDDPSVLGKISYIARYPNPLNNIGDKFNLDKDGIRKLDSFNPFQSRPIFSMFAFFYTICQAFGYRLKIDESVDFNLLRDTYLVTKGVEESVPVSEVLVTSTTPTISTSNPQWWDYDKHGAGTGDNEAWYEFFFIYPNTVVTVDDYGKKIGVESLTPNQINPAYTPVHKYNRKREDLQTQNCVVKIEQDPFIGQVVWTGTVNKRTPDNRFQFREFIAKSVWKDPDGNVFEMDFTIESETKMNPERTFTVTGDKAQLNDTPGDAEEFVGLILRVIVRHEDQYYNDVPQMSSLHFIEKVLPKGKTSFDPYGQFISNRTNLLKLAPDTSISELLKSCLQQQGLLLTFERDTNGMQNIVKLFTYGAYRNRVRDLRLGIPNSYYDWSKYHQRYVPPLWNTDYGTSYGEMNEVSLSNPFSGNVSKIQISTNVTSKGFQSKLIPLAQNRTKSFDDVSAVNSVFNTTPYFEYTMTTQGLIRCSFDQFLPGDRKQYNADSVTSLITCDPLPVVSNVIYSDDFLPIGIKEWYYLVDVSVRCQATFLLPLLVVQTLDLSKPVFIENLGGFYIVEQVEEYTDNLTTVKVSLIKLPNPPSTPEEIPSSDYLLEDYSDSDYYNN